ncbi:MAG TPA: carboxymuconolactone decarboxylase family protein [Paracoccaceae bacterium]|nr:carboxymuconolactone decarboxylase family protein [Paracoccaceae bacterium]
MSVSPESPREDELWEAGLATRRAVVGEAYVARSLEAMDGLTAPLQDWVTRYAWGDVWNRPGLARRDRSILNIGMLVALNRPAELKLHLAGALRNGVTPDEIRECLLQSAVYCGAPAALDAFRIAREVLAEAEGEAPEGAG